MEALFTVLRDRKRALKAEWEESWKSWVRDSNIYGTKTLYHIGSILKLWENVGKYMIHGSYYGYINIYIYMYLYLYIYI